MRLRLRIERNELPAVATLWPINNSELKLTIAQLLEKINGRFPLESNHWGLEHYAVCVGGYECLHYHELGAVLHDEDEVVVRPLQTAEVRARTMLGRDQIDTDGKHLVDGIPFGRPLLRRLRRPDLRIPPPQRQKTDDDTPSLDDGDILQITNVDHEDDDDDDEEEDGDFLGLSEEDEEDELFEGLSENEEGVEAIEDETNSDESSSDDDSDDDDSSSSEESSDESSDTTSNDDEPSDRILDPITQAQTMRREKFASEEQSPAQKHPPKKTVPPGQGMSRTRERNRRKRDQARLKYLKSKGVLPEDANLSVMAAFDAIQNANSPKNDKPAELMDRTVECDSDSDRPNVDEGDAANRTDSNRVSRFEVERQALLHAIASGGVDITASGKRRDKANSVNENDEPPEEMPIIHSSQVETNRISSKAETDQLVLTPSTDSVESAQTSSRRNRLDVAGARRLMFGSLGVKVPKSQRDKDVTQEKLAIRAGRNATEANKTNKEVKQSEPREEHAPDGQDEDPEAWREKIDLRAVECTDEGFTLSTPPFPFYPRWDPQQRGNKKKKRASSAYMTPAKRRKTGIADAVFVETYDKYNKSGTGDALDYDDAEDDEYWEEGALIGEEYDEDNEDSASQQLLREAHDPAVEDDFPAMPESPESLPGLTDDQAQINDYIVYKELVLSAATSWQPEMQVRTVQLQERDEERGGWKVLRALRDLPPKEFDEDGNRVYSKFEMEGMSDDGDEEEERLVHLQWTEMAEPRLLQRDEST